MNSILTAFAAIANLARSFNRLAGVVDRISDEAERRVEVLGHQPAGETPALNGHSKRPTRVIEAGK